MKRLNEIELREKVLYELFSKRDCDVRLSMSERPGPAGIDYVIDYTIGGDPFGANTYHISHDDREPDDDPLSWELQSLPAFLESLEVPYTIRRLSDSAVLTANSPLKKRKRSAHIGGP